jgi:hypothetical protein
MRRVSIEDLHPETWGKEYDAARLTMVDAGVFCSWVCVAAYAAERVEALAAV